MSHRHGRQMLVLFGMLALFCRSLTFAAQSSEAASAEVVANRPPLQANAYSPLPLGAIEPKGWLGRQLQIQAAGLTGHLDEFWSDVGPNSGWLGGSGESWERGPYYLDGLLPLAYELNDPTLLKKAKQWVEWTLTHQRANGQIGPMKNDDWWPRMIMLKVLTQYQEASGDPRVIPLMQKYFAYELRELPNRPLRDWGKYRWQDNVYSVLWLYNRTGNKSLLNLARLLHDQGYDWEADFANFRYTSKETSQKLGLKAGAPIPDEAMQTHGVNNAMALKAAPIWWLLTGNPLDRQELNHQLALLDKYHGLPNGMFSGDEHFAGPDPSQGIELCAVVETMFSLEQAFAITGDPRFADRLEKVSYNALPGTLSNDIWSHQYDQQPNQIACTRAHRQWSTNGADSNLFGLEPNFGCCTANLHQGWPKFASSLWMKTRDSGLVTVAYAPNEVHTKLAGVDVSVDEDTDYPFRGRAQFTVKASRPAEFPLVLRIPIWASGATIKVNGDTFRVAASGCVAASTQAQTDELSCDVSEAFYPIKRTWKDGDRVSIDFSWEPRVSHWYNNSAVFELGPLVFSLPLEGQWSELKKYAEKSADWQITPAQSWNYAVELGNCDAAVSEHSIGPVSFDVNHPPLVLHVKARRDPGWSVEENSAGPVPASPVNSTEPLTNLDLVPYGAAKLRITAFPYLKEQSQCGSADTVPKLPVPSGPFGIGRIGYDWVDSSRPDKYSSIKNAHRELMVYFWYPTTTKSADTKGVYLPGAQRMDALPEVRDVMRQEFGTVWPAMVSGAIFSHALDGAPVARSSQPFPVVLFSHGLGCTGFEYTSLIEDLVSRGYVVASIEHPYVALAVWFPGGRVVLSHDDPPPSRLSPTERWNWMVAHITEQISQGAADVRFVLDRMAVLNGSPQKLLLAGRVDLNRVAAMGHSAGAEFAARACQLDTRLKACVDLDGAMPPLGALPEYPDRATLKQPLLFLEAFYPENRIAGSPAEHAAFFKKKEEQLQTSRPGTYDVVLRSQGMSHSSFDDVPLLFARDDGRAATGGALPLQLRVTREVALHNLDLIESYVDEFVDKNLKGNKAPLLESANATVSEATVRQYGH